MKLAGDPNNSASFKDDARADLATTNPNLKAKLLLRALEFLALVDDTDDRTLCVFQEVLDEFKPQLVRKP